MLFGGIQSVGVNGSGEQTGSGRPMKKKKTDSYRTNEVKSYLIPFNDLPRPVFWFNDELLAGTWSGIHVHEKWGELAFMRSGYMVICTEFSNYLVPPQRAVWIPPGHAHEWYTPRPSVDCGLYIMPGMLPDDERFGRVHAMEVTFLVRELIHALSTQRHEYVKGPVSRMVHVLLDQIALLPVVDFPSVMPQDHRLVELSTQLIDEPDSQTTIREWCTRLGMSERTLARQFQRQTGESVGRWRQQVRMRHALECLEAGENVTAVALNCGYQSVSSFIAVFKKVFGQTPGQLLQAQRKERGSP